MKDDSKRGRGEVKGSTRHTYLDVNGMDIDVEPEDLATNGELHEVILGGAPKPMGPIMTVMGILLRVEVGLKEADTCMQDGDETSWWQLTDARPSVTTLQQARLVILTHLKRCDKETDCPPYDTCAPYLTAEFDHTDQFFPNSHTMLHTSYKGQDPT
jgi:hypothetical protein